MQAYYSEKENNFYFDSVHGADIPIDSVAISGELYQSIIDGKSLGKIVEAGADGMPALVDPAPVAVDPAQAIAARRYAAEVGGITVSGMRVETDDRSKLLVNGAAVEAMLDPDYSLRWKTLDGFVVLTGEQVLGVARAVRAHVQACFDREAELLAAVEDGTYTEAMLEQGWPV